MKTAVSYHVISKYLYQSGKQTIKCYKGCVCVGGDFHAYCWWECTSVRSSWTTVWEFLKELKVILLHIAIHLLKWMHALGILYYLYVCFCDWIPWKKKSSVGEEVFIKLIITVYSPSLWESRGTSLKQLTTLTDKCRKWPCFCCPRQLLYSNTVQHPNPKTAGHIHGGLSGPTLYD